MADAGTAAEAMAAKQISAAQQAAQASQVQFDAIQRRTESLQVALRSTDTEAQATLKLESAERQLARAFQDGNLALSTRARINQELTRIERALSQHRAAPALGVVSTEGAPAAAAAMRQVSSATEQASRSAAKLLAMQQALPSQFRQIARDILAAREQFKSGAIQSDGLTAALGRSRAALLALNEQVGGVPRSQAETYRLLLAETAVEATKAGGAFTALALDVQRATTAYKAGAIGLESYQTALAVARAEAIGLAGNTANLSKGELTTFNTILRQTDQAAKTTARQGLGTMRSSMFALAASMVGTRSTAGTLAGALLQFSIGNTLAVGVAAGVLGLVVVYERLTRATHEASEEQDKLLTKLRQVREEREAAEDPLIAFKKSVDAIAAQARDLQNQLKAEQLELKVATGDAPVRERHIADLRKQLRDLGKDASDALRTFNGAVGEISEKRVNDLVERLNAGKATRAEEVELRAELVKSQAALAGLSDAYRATAQGSERAGKLTQRITSIESAFEAQAKKTGKAVADAAKALTERTQALIALQQLEGPTVERWQALTDRAATLRQELKAGNLALDQRVAKLRELRDIEASTGFGDVDQFERIKTRGPDIARTPGPLMTVQPQLPNVETGNKGSIFASLIKQTQADGTALVDAVNQVQEQLDAAAQQLASTFSDALTSGISDLASGKTNLAGAIAEVTGGLLAALGRMAIAFGVKAIAIAGLMKKILDAFKLLKPLAAIAAGIALVALGAALSGAARDSFGGSAASSAGASLAPVSRTVTVQGSTTPATATSASGTATAPVFNFTVIGADDPAAQRQIARMVTLANARGVA